jgi:flagellar motor switch protein FliG|tara:strand:- start:1 stop:1023 length:1023 start_codon:yes stop_codon:yes gene_type:complete
MAEATLSTKKQAKEGGLTQTQKLAAFLVIMGEDSASEIIKNFDDNERELVCAEMANLPLLDAAAQGAVLQEFTTMAVEATSSVGGSVDYTRKVLEKSVGLFKAAEIIGRVGTARTSVATMQQIIDLDATSICNLVKEEDAQTIALLVSYLSAAKGSEVLMSLPEKVREVVIEKLATLESTPIEVVETLGEVLSAKVGERVSRALNQTGGEKSAAAVLNAMHKDERKKLLDNMDERAPDLVRSIRMKMFTFEDLQQLDVKTMQKIMREVDAGKLAVALSAAPGELQEAMLGALSKRAAENVKDEIENMGKVSLREIETNQNSIIDVVRQLETEGEISLEAE